MRHALINQVEAKGLSQRAACWYTGISRAVCKKDPSSPPRPHQAEYPKPVWTYDILFDRLADGRPFKTLSVLDEFTRECVGILAATSILAEDIIAFLDEIMKKRNSPVFLRSDNGSEFTAEAVQTWLAEKNVGPAFIPPGQPWKNGFIESFHDKFRDECLQREWFSSLLDAQVVIEDWRLHYNTKRPTARWVIKPRRISPPNMLPNFHPLSRSF